MRTRNIIIIFSALVLISLCNSCTTEVHPTLNPKWADITLRVTGDGAPPARAVNKAQARLMAKEAAIADAYRELARQVSGVRVDWKHWSRILSPGVTELPWMFKPLLKRQE